MLRVLVAGRGSADPLFFAGALLCLSLAATGKGYWSWWLGLLMLAPILSRPVPRARACSPGCRVLLAYLGVLALNTLFVDPAVSHIQWLLILLPLFGFLAASASSLKSLKQGFLIWTLMYSLLALWTLGVYGLGGEGARNLGVYAVSLFQNPNIFALCLNLLLLPLLALFLFRGDFRWLLPALLLFIPLLLIGSRGGLLGLAVGIGFLGLYARRSPRVMHRRWVLVAVSAVLLSVSAQLFLQGAAATGGQGGALASEPAPTTAQHKQRNIQVRLEFYAIAAELIAREPWLGHGYFNTRALLNSAKPESLAPWTSHYVHNDYLQIWMENGVPGLLALLLLVVRPFWLALRGPPPRPSAWLLPAASLSALAAMFSHALVSFPFYSPLPLFLMGVLLAVSERHKRVPMIAHDGARQRRFHPVRLMVPALLLGLVWLAQPIGAAWAAQSARHQLSAGDLVGALEAYTLAQRLAPHEPFNYWAAGMIWRDQALSRGDADAALRAERLFAAGTAADPYAFDNLLARLRLRRDHGALLGEEGGEGREQLLRWARRLQACRPHDAVIRAEAQLTFSQLRRVSASQPREGCDVLAGGVE